MLQDPDVVVEFMTDIKRMMQHNEILIHHYNVIVEELEEMRNNAFQIAYLTGKGKTRRARRIYRRQMKDRVWLPMSEM